MFESALLAIASTINFILAGSILSRKGGISWYSRFFALAAMAVGFWGATTIILNIFTNMFWERLLYISALSSIYFITLFSFEFIKTRRKLLISIITSGYLVLGAMILFTELIIVSVSKGEDGGINVERGNLTLFFTFYVILSLIILARNLVVGYFKSDAIKQQQLQYIILGIILFVTPALLSNMLLPLAGIQRYNNLGVVFSILFTSSVTMAIVRHRLFSIKTIMLMLVRSFIIGLALFLIVISQRILKEKLLTLDTFDTEALILDFLTALTVGAFIQEFVIWVGRRIGTIINSEVVKLENLAKEIDQKASDSLDINQVVQNVVPILENSFSGTEVYFLEKFEDHVRVIPERSHTLEISPELLSITQTPLILQESNKDSLLEKTLRRKHIDIIAELTQEFYLVIKSNQNREFYTKTELDTIEDIITKLTDIFSRVLVHQKTVEFKDKLQQKVDEQTKELQEKVTALEEARRKERDMLDILAHELRTPLTISKNAVKMIDQMAEGNAVLDQGNLKKYSDMADENLDRESRLLETMLTTTKIDNDKLDLNFEKVDINDVIADSIEALKHKARKKGLELRQKIDGQLYAFADRGRFQEVIDNLVDNASQLPRTKVRGLFTSLVAYCEYVTKVLDWLSYKTPHTFSSCLCS